MRFHADHYFAIGAAHLSSGKPCQDHALSGSSSNLACAVIADGCSSGGHTDVGARILTLSTMQAMRASAKLASIDSIVVFQQDILKQSRSLFGLEKSDMLSTCAYACVSSEGAIIHVQGDGVAAIKMRDGSVDMHRFEWENNTPFYPSYTANGEEYAFFAHHGARALLASTVIDDSLRSACEQYVKTGSISGILIDHIDHMIGFGKNSPALTVESVRIDLEGREASARQSVFAETGIRGHVLLLSPEQLRLVQLIAVFSDGVGQVENMDWKESTTTFLGAKVLKGEFVKRSMIFGIRGAKSRGKGPIDDVSAAMICVEEE